jgi:hypothetical protein
MITLAWTVGLLAILAAICAVPWLCWLAIRSIIHQWRSAPAGTSAFNPLLELVQPQCHHVVEVHEHRRKEDDGG